MCYLCSRSGFCETRLDSGRVQLSLRKTGFWHFGLIFQCSSSTVYRYSGLQSKSKAVKQQFRKDRTELYSKTYTPLEYRSSTQLTGYMNSASGISCAIMLTQCEALGIVI